MMYLKRLLFGLKGIFLISLLVTLLSARVYTVRGRVVSELTRSPVSYGNVAVEGTDKGAVTSNSGTFEVDVSTLPVTLRITHIGYAERVIHVSEEEIGTVLMMPTVLTGEEVLITASRAVEGETPVAFSTLDRHMIDMFYSHQDVPMVLNNLPGVYAYSDAGNGVGYTYLKIRGFSQDRIGVMLNGIPLNDPEAHAVYWVDHGDILAAAGDVQLQRGVGNSLYGTSVFGGTVNMVTNFHSLFPGFTISTGYGDYIEKSRLSLPSRKFSASYAGGPWRDRGITLYARYSNLGSGGYRVGSGSQQQSYHVGVEKNTSTSLTRFEAIVGQEVTAFAWEGIIPQYGYDLKDREGKYGRRYNFYADPEFNGGRDDANKDVFVQSIVSVQHSRKVRAGLFSLTLYDVNGDGYYEQFKGKRDVVEYNLTDVTASDVHEVDLMRRKWLKNGYRGFVYQFSHPIGLGSMTVGGDARFYRSDHFGKVLEIIGGPAVPGDHRYYSDGSTKTSFSFYVQSRLDITRKIKVMADIRYLGHRYSFDQNVLGAFTHGYRYNLKYDFIDPHLGIQYRLSSRLSLFGNVSTGHREPADGDIYDHDDPRVAPAVEDMNEDYATPLTKEEFLIDYEAGLSFIARDFQGTVNIYRMDFRDELIPVYYRYYDADDVLHANAPRTVYQGVEAAVVSTPYRWLTIDGNVSLSRNRFIEYSGDSLGWGGWGGIADYSQKIIPAYPSFQAKGAVIISRGNAEGWLQVLHAGKQFIDFTNTEEAALHPFTVLNAGVRFEIPGGGSVKPSVSIRINNVLDKLYATFGYNYYDDVDQRRDAFWPGATRNYYVTFSLRR